MKQIPKTGNINSFTNGRVIEEELSVHQKVVGRKELNLNKSLRAECGILWRVRTFVNLDRRVCTHQLFSMLLHHKFRRKKEIKAENLRGLPSMTQVEENSAHFLQPFYMLIKSWKLMRSKIPSSPKVKILPLKDACVWAQSPNRVPLYEGEIKENIFLIAEDRIFQQR